MELVQEYLNSLFYAFVFELSVTILFFPFAVFKKLKNTLTVREYFLDSLFLNILVTPLIAFVIFAIIYVLKIHGL